MDKKLRNYADYIVKAAINAVLPDEAVKRALEGQDFPGRVFLVSVGKAGWQMAKAAYDLMGERITDGIVVTKYHHIKEPIENCHCYEAGHPVPDENSFLGTEAVLNMVSNLSATDTVLFLLSGGGSALFEKPLVSGEVLQNVTNQLLGCGADIVEINTIRKRLSAVKGGRFAEHCAPAKVFSVVLSDIVGDPLDMIASGPACADSSTCEQAVAIAEKYQLNLTTETWELLRKETPKELSNVTTQITGSVRQLCKAAEAACQALGFETIVLTDTLSCEARDAGKCLAGHLMTSDRRNVAFIAGGETVVKLTGKGLGGRNQELALSAAEIISGADGAAVFSVGSDGTDGPTDAAGGYVDYETSELLKSQGILISEVLADNDAYHALQAVDGLIMTGPTGTNVNDVAVALLIS